MMQAIAEFAPELWTGMLETLWMTFGSVLFAYLLGLPLGVWLITSHPDGIRPNKPLNALLGWVINVGRSIPFIILIVALIPFTRLVTGTSIGATAAIVPLCIGAAPFVARMVEQTLKAIDPGMIEAARTMGATDWQIICKVLLPESIPALIRGLSIAVITLIGYSAMAGAVGAGGLGHIAISYGYHRNQPGMMLATILLLILIVQLIQGIFSLWARAIDKRNK